MTDISICPVVGPEALTGSTRLKSGTAQKLVLERGLMVQQGTGEDWSDVRLTLSTSRPSDRSTPSEVYPRIVSAYDPETRARRGAAAGISGRHGERWGVGGHGGRVGAWHTMHGGGLMGPRAT